MIRYLSIAATVLTLGACTASGMFAPVSLASVEQACKNGCALELPIATAAADLAALLVVLAPAEQTAVVIAGMLCSAVAALPPTAAPGLGAPTAVVVRGVTVHVARHS